MGFSSEDIHANHEYFAHKLRAEKIAATPGGVQNLAVMRFKAATKVFHAGETMNEYGSGDAAYHHVRDEALSSPHCMNGQAALGVTPSG